MRYTSQEILYKVLDIRDTGYGVPPFETQDTGCVVLNPFFKWLDNTVLYCTYSQYKGQSRDFDDTEYTLSETLLALCTCGARLCSYFVYVQ
jgi:hypothetical protein